jgi:hypothetical protein
MSKTYHLKVLKPLNAENQVYSRLSWSIFMLLDPDPHILNTATIRIRNRQFNADSDSDPQQCSYIYARFLYNTGICSACREPRCTDGHSCGECAGGGLPGGVVPGPGAPHPGQGPALRLHQVP